MKDMEQGNHTLQTESSNTVSENTPPENGTPQMDANMPGTGDMLENSGEVEVPVRKSEKKRLFLIAAVVAVIALIIGISFFSNSKDRKLQEQLDLGAKYIDELEYEQALACYLSAVEIDPMSVDAYLGVIEVYIRTGEYDLALEWAEKGYELTGDEQLAEKAEMIRSGNISRWDGQPVKMIHFDESRNASWWWEYTYDRENRQNSISHYGADGNLIKTLPITYDEEGNQLESYASNGDTGELIRAVRGYENGSCISYVEYESDDTTVDRWEIYENDEEGREIRSIRGYGSNIGEKEEISEYTESEYDEKGNIIKWSVYDANHKLNWYHIWEYDEAGRIQKCAGYEADGSLAWYEIYEYNGEGKIKSRKRYNDNGELEYENTYK